ncbi:hypothetical protein [Piscinibacter sp. XHJ-5]|uniref:hypothetical protein n=1 Tax=Piscinibacter sp. XHJ-5 TaxID=3037797 RepID=UPI00245352BB|nr:hypothetical protein [Piscinibacter sp. XHJ-5]
MLTPVELRDIIDLLRAAARQVHPKAAAGICVVMWLATYGTAWAGRPLNADDASILPEGACQLETWLRPSRHLQQVVLQPACNPWGGIEWGASLTRQRATDEPSQSLLGLQAKTVFKEVEAGTWGVGGTFGLTRSMEGGGPGTTRTGTLIFSVSPSQPLVLHVNAGVVQAHSRHAVANWGAAVEFGFNERWTLIAETYGERHGRPARQIGARTWVRPESLQLDATLGHEHLNGRRETFFTLGLAWVWEVWARP